MLEALGELLFKADKFKRMHPNIVGHHSLDRTDKQNVTRQFAQPILGVDYEVEFVGKRSWTSNLNIIGEVSDRQTKHESRRSRVVGQPLLNNSVGRAGKRKGLDGKVACGRKRFDAAGQNLFLLERLNVKDSRLRQTENVNLYHVNKLTVYYFN